MLPLGLGRGCRGGVDQARARRSAMGVRGDDRPFGAGIGEDVEVVREDVQRQIAHDLGDLGVGTSELPRVSTSEGHESGYGPMVDVVRGTPDQHRTTSSEP